MERLADHPARFVVTTFAIAIAVGTLLLWLPWSSPPGARLSVLDAVFTATSAVCVTGLTVVDTGTGLSTFGQVVVLVLVHLGGLGFMTLASLIALLLSRRLGLRMSLAATAERSTLQLGDVRRVLWGVAAVTVAVEFVLAVVLTVRFWLTYGDGIGTATWRGVFYAVMTFNNGGFSLFPDSLDRFAGDVVITGPIMVGIVIGGLGFPVLVDLVVRRPNRRHLSVHSKLTLVGTGVLLVAGFAMVLGFEWSNPATLGPMGVPEKGWVASFGSVAPRTAGFHVITPADMTDQTTLGTAFLMFIGAGSAGTSGGIKVGTFFLLGMVIVAELRARRDVVAFGRRIPETVLRQALTVALLSVGVVALTTTTLMALTHLTMTDVLFEAVAAFSTAGLSTGITPTLPVSGKLLLMAVMLIGRVGPVTLFTALVLRQRASAIRHPEEAPLIG